MHIKDCSRISLKVNKVLFSIFLMPGDFCNRQLMGSMTELCVILKD